MTSGPPPLDTPSGRPIEVRRSPRRRRTVSARREGDRTVVLIPASFSRAQERTWVAAMIAKLEASEARRRPGDIDLAARAARLSDRYLAGAARPVSVRWVTNQASRWGSCTPSEGTIRLSHRLQGMPDYVVDYVILHELAHLLSPGHGPQFWRLLEGYPHLDRARGFLDGVALAKGLPALDDAPHDVEGDPAL